MTYCTLLDSGLAKGKIHVEEILKNFESTTAFHLARNQVSAMRGFLEARKQLDSHTTKYLCVEDKNSSM